MSEERDLTDSHTTTLGPAKTLHDALAVTQVPASGRPGVVPGDGSEARLDEMTWSSRFEWRAPLGAGGMGEVHLYRDLRIGRDVAVKVARTGTGSRGDFAARFAREARVQGQLEHPAIVPVHELGQLPTGETYFTMKRVRGLTLEEVVRALAAGEAGVQKRFSRRKLLTAFSSVCMAVHFAHARGILHRDLKPANIMLGDFGEVYVLDWGLAKQIGAPDELALPRREQVLSAAASAPGSATTSGAVMGTPGYMAPEQARGQIETLDERTDVYALGAVLFEILARTPLHGETSGAATLAATIDGVDARASVRAPDADVPPELDAICLKATALAPEDRYPTALDLHDAIERFLDGDRDVERRRALADEWAAAAAHSLERALDDADDKRAEAARSVALEHAGRALALAPSHPGALHVMMRLLILPPRKLPAEVLVDIERRADEANVRIMRWAGFLYSAWLLIIPFFMAMGLRDGRPFAVWLATVLLTAGTMAVCARIRVRRKSPMVLVGLALGTGTVLGISSVFGPYVLVPGLVVINMMGFLFQSAPRWRPTIFIAGVVSGCLPMLAEWVGILPQTTTFVGNSITITPYMVDFPPGLTRGALIAAEVGVTPAGGAFAMLVRRQLDVAEKKLQLQTWQLQQLIPAAARTGSGGTQAIPDKPMFSCALDRKR